MEKQLKDYLHLYLGCDVIGYYKSKDVDTGAEVIVELKKRLVRIDEDGTAWLSGNIRINDFNPILRPLSDMTDEEDAEYLRLVHEREYKGIRNIFKDADGIKYLLSKHFDIFSLIEDGLAIDITTIK